MNAQAIAVEHRTGKAVMSSMHAMYSLGGLSGALGTAFLTTVPMLVHLLGITCIGLVLLPVCLQHLTTDVTSIVPAAPVRQLAMPPRSLQGLCLLALCVFLCERAIADWSALLLHESKGASQAISALGFASFAACILIDRLVGDHLRTAFAEHRLIRCLALVSCIGLLLNVLSENVWICIFGFGLAGLGFSIMVPVIISVAGKRGDVDASVAVVAVSSFGYAGLLVGPPFMGFLVQAITLQ
jgi:fucose permease